MKKKILVTGATGRIGRIVTEDLAGRYELTMTSRRRIEKPGFHRIDIAEEYDEFKALVAGRDAIVHLAYAEVEDDGATARNLAMVRNVYRAAFEALPRPRLVMSSSVHAVGGYVDWAKEPYASIARRDYGTVSSRPKPVTADAPLYPNSPYGALKGYIELMGKYYASRGLEVVVIRYGGVRPDDAFPPEPGYHAFFLSRRDCAHLVERAIEAELTRSYNVVFGVSRNSWRVHDIESASALLGYEPRDDGEEFAAVER